jgi:hypothetical protein
VTQQRVVARENSSMTKSNRQKMLDAMAREAAKGVRERGALSRMEMDTEEAKRRFGQEEMDRKLAALPPEDNRPKACPKCRKNARVRAKAVERSFTSLGGTHTLRRNFHYCEVCKEGFYPRDEFLGLPKHGDVSAELEKRTADLD